MGKVFRWGFLLLILGCNSKPAVQDALASSKARVGAPAPNFSLESIDGKKVSLSNYKGKVVLLDFWTTWCPPCRMSTPVLVHLNEKLKAKGFLVIGISLDENTSPVLPFIRKEKVQHPILYSDSNVQENYQIHAIPSFFLVDKNGILTKKYEGFEFGLEKVWEKEINDLLSKN